MQEHKVVTSLQRIQSYDPHGGPFTTIGGVIREKAQIDMLLAYDFTELGKNEHVPAEFTDVLEVHTDAEGVKAYYFAHIDKVYAGFTRVSQG